MTEATLAWNAAVDDTPILVVFDGPLPYPVPLRKDIVNIGGDADVDVRLTATNVAPRHGMIQRSASGFDIFRLSGGALSVNGATVEASPLRSGDEVRIAGVRMVFLDPRADVLPPGMQLWFTMPNAAAAAATPAADTGSASSFDVGLLDALRRAPWVLISGVLHLLIYILMFKVLDRPPTADAHRTEISVAIDATEIPDTDQYVNEELWIDEVEPIVTDFLDQEVEPDMPEDMAAPDAVDADTTDADAPLPGAPFSGQRGGLGAAITGGGRSGPDLGRVEAGTRATVQSLRQSGLDVVFVVDATGSMGRELDAAKHQVGDVIVLLKSLGLDFRLGVVAYRDHGADEEYVTRNEPLTRYVFRAVNFLDNVSAMGGGDPPEAVFDAIREAVDMKWAPKARKIIVLVGDAPPHAARMAETERLCSRFAARGGQVFTIFADNRDDSLLVFKRDQVRQVFENLAKAGGGGMRSLGDTRLLVEEIVMLTLNASRADVRTLMNDIRMGFHSRHFSERADAGDIAFVERELCSPRPKPVTSRVLLAQREPTLVAAYMAALNCPTTPVATRWMIAVLMRRMIVRGDMTISVAGRAALAALDPEASIKSERRKLQALAKSLLDAGLLGDSFVGGD